VPQVDVRREMLDAGFFIGAHSAAGSKFKLLLFEQGDDGQWELLMQARSRGAGSRAACGAAAARLCGTRAILPCRGQSHALGACSHRHDIGEAAVSFVGRSCVWPAVCHERMTLRVSHRACPTVPLARSQEDSVKAQKTIQIAGLYFLGFDTFHVGPRASPLELQVPPRRLPGRLPGAVAAPGAARAAPCNARTARVLRAALCSTGAARAGGLEPGLLVQLQVAGAAGVRVCGQYCLDSDVHRSHSPLFL